MFVKVPSLPKFGANVPVFAFPGFTGAKGAKLIVAELFTVGKD